MYPQVMKYPSTPVSLPDRSPVGRAPTRRRADTRARLLDAASQVFAERGFGRATVEEVCERAGYTRGAFYSNFDSLDGLFFALHDARSAALVEAVRQAVQDTPERLTVAAVVDRVIAVLPISRESHLLNLEFAAHALRHPEVAVALAGHRRAVREALEPVLRAGLQAVDAEFQGSDDELARSLVAVQEGMFLQELLEPGQPGLPALRRRLLSQVLERQQA